MSQMRRLHPSKSAMWRGIAALATPFVAMDPVPVLAHTRARPTPETVWSAWNIDPLISTGILLASWLYLRGVFALWQRAGRGKVIQRWQVWAFGGAMVSLVVALISPLDALGGALFSAHMVQHVLLFLVTPMLLAASRPIVALTWALPEDHRKRLLTWGHRQGSVRTMQSLWANPVIVWMIFTGVLWIWHVPALYDAALRSDLIHRLEHLSFLAAAYLFWSWLLGSSAGRQTRNGLAILFVFTSVIQSGILGAILTFARSPVYEAHVPYTGTWNLSVIEDQQLAGLIMWIPMGLWFTLTTVLIFVAWLRDADRSVRQWESTLDDGGAPLAETISPQRR